MDFRRTDDYTTLTPSQRAFVDLYYAGHNLFLTGEAGTGKSHVLRSLFDYLRDHGVAVAKTASTGIAAFNIGGQTIHSWAGMGLAEGDAHEVLRNVKKNKKAIARMKQTKVLVLDEVSMIRGDLLDKLDIVLKYMRGSNRPFGGVQLILTGDFLQLPAIFKRGEVKTLAFQSRSWREANIQPALLTEIVRQGEDGDFARLLGQIRVGDTSGLKLLASRVNAPLPDAEIEPTRIFCKNIEVDTFNRERLADIEQPLHTFASKDWGEERYIQQFDKHCQAAKVLYLKVGAQVMLLQNLDVKRGLVNGSVGVVKGFAHDGVRVRFRYETVTVEMGQWEIKEQRVSVGGVLQYQTVATRSQYPLKLAYALSVHKSQGTTLDCAIVDMSEAFAESQVYVALSRVRNLQSLFLHDFPSSAIRVNEDCLAFYRALEKPVATK